MYQSVPSTEWLAPFLAVGGGEWTQAVADPVPSEVISRLLGFPEADLPRVMDWAMQGGARGEHGVRLTDAVQLEERRGAVDAADQEASQVGRMRLALGKRLLDLAPGRDQEHARLADAVHGRLSAQPGEERIGSVQERGIEQRSRRRRIHKASARRAASRSAVSR